MLPVGNYQATILAGNVADAGGVPLAANFSLNIAQLAGDWNLDGQRDVRDVFAMEGAMVNLNGYAATNNLTNAQLIVLGDVNGDKSLNNADEQALLNVLRGIGLLSGSGSTDAATDSASSSPTGQTAVQNQTGVPTSAELVPSSAAPPAVPEIPTVVAPPALPVSLDAQQPSHIVPVHLVSINDFSDRSTNAAKTIYFHTAPSATPLPEKAASKQSPPIGKNENLDIEAPGRRKSQQVITDAVTSSNCLTIYFSIGNASISAYSFSIPVFVSPDRSRRLSTPLKWPVDFAQSRRTFLSCNACPS